MGVRLGANSIDFHVFHLLTEVWIQLRWIDFGWLILNEENRHSKYETALKTEVHLKKEL